MYTMHKNASISTSSDCVQNYPLYDARWEHDACGTGFLAHISGEANHALVQMALEALARLTHRGAQDADAETNDGAGILTQIPRTLFGEVLQQQGLFLSDLADLGVGMLFLPSQDDAPEAYWASRRLIERAIADAGLTLLTWRTPPIDYKVLGTRARQMAPTIQQVLLARPAHVSLEQYERDLYYVRRRAERLWRKAQLYDCYIASLSSRTIVYKGLLAPAQLPRFYLDLADPRYTSAIAVFHQRYSTNTFPSWPLAQPMRMLAHNGEINTIQGNRNWMLAREGSMASPLWGERVHDLMPVIQESSSDSGQLDNALELLAQSGRGLLHSMQMLLPPAWEQDVELDAAQRAWCEYHAGLIEPWDGPAALAFSDGTVVGAALDRNGLRPARYMLTANGLFVLASEAGVVSCPPNEIIENGRLGPGEMVAVDVVQHRVLRDAEIKETLAHQQPYGRWLEDHLVRLAELVDADETLKVPEDFNPETLFTRQQLFGFTNEDGEMVLRPMLQDSKEPVWSMGDDAPLAVLSQLPRSFSDHFHQRFAQVTNPPIDPLRERVVMSLESYMGRSQSLLTESSLHARLLHLKTPILTEIQLERMREINSRNFQTITLSTTFPITGAVNALEKALDQLEAAAIEAVTNGATLLILSDKDATLERAPMPMLIAVGAVHRALIRSGQRMGTSLICETGTAWDIHQVSLLLGYGAEAVVPFLALESVRALAGERRLEELTRESAVERYIHVLEEGLRKIMARMGISTIRNMIGAGQFEVLGLETAFAARCFSGSPVHPGTFTYAHVAEQIIKHCQSLQQTANVSEAPTHRRKLTDLGRFRFRRDAEYHAFNPLIVRALQKTTRSGSVDDYAQFTALVYRRPPTALRDLLSFKETTPVPLDEVEPMEAIRARFVVSAMSLGALSPETHKTIAAAMNSIGGRNNTGEGGEDPNWYHETMEGYEVSSKIKQIASGRFGVTPEYLVRAQEIEIKMAQGSKPGEGGQLPQNKVTPFIARLRHTAPGVSLISPPPHHDIYSIEDIAQLIYDLHRINPKAKVGVKLVSSIGVGTIAAGVAKGHADYVLISGHDGGTGASPLQSIKHAGMPWERGLSETQQVLVKNGLRSRVKVRVDGGFKTGRDVVIGAMLGADEFGFGTAALVSLGCDMARQCHLNTCPTGIATQREDLRAKFSGRPQYLINLMTLVAEEVREWMAQLGFRTFDELIGRADLLAAPEDASIDFKSMLVALPYHAVEGAHRSVPSAPVAEQLLVEAEEALAGERSVLIQHGIHNDDRSVGVSLAGEIARRYGNKGLPGVSITCAFQGSAGQSFGAFCVPGLRLILNGEANDYVGKGMTGGQIVIAPPADARFASHENTIVGNTVLYGATGGQLFVAGRAGERFAVRNSGALAVVEGVGDHGCEYMTSGLVAVLGETGRNFGAGMSAGVAYVLDEQDMFPLRCNTELVGLQRIDDASELEALRVIIGWHARKTRSKRATYLLDNWQQMRHLFWRVQPKGCSTTAHDFADIAEYDNAVRGASHS